MRWRRLASGYLLSVAYSSLQSPKISHSVYPRSGCLLRPGRLTVQSVSRIWAPVAARGISSAFDSHRLGWFRRALVRRRSSTRAQEYPALDSGLAGVPRAACIELDLRLPWTTQKQIVREAVDRLKLHRDETLYLGLSGFLESADIARVESILQQYYGLVETVAAEANLPPTFDATVLLPHQTQRLLKQGSFDVLLPAGLSETEVESILSERRRQGHRPFEVLEGPPLSDFDEPSDFDSKLDIGEPRQVCVGGTFDQLHSGHKILLTISAILAAIPGPKQGRLVLGLSDGPLLAGKRYPDLIQSFELREERLRSFLEVVEPGINVQVFALSDPFGPSVELPWLTTLVVSEETSQGGEAVNNERTSRGMSPLELHAVKLVADTRMGVEDKVSSTYIRQFLHEEAKGVIEDV